MKNLGISIIKLFLLGVSLFGCFNCTENIDKTNIVHILIDLTERNQADRVLPLKDLIETLSKNQYGDDKAGLKAYVHTISDLSDTKTHKISKEIIPAAPFANPLNRLDEKEEFEKELTNVFKVAIQENSAQGGRAKSKIYAKICDELNRPDIHSGKTVIVIFSDMLENDKISFYTDQNKVKSLTNNIDTTEELLNKLYNCKFPDLSNTEIYVVADRNPKNDELINTAKGFWITLFKKHNCKKIVFDSQLLL